RELGRLLSDDGPESVVFEVTIHPREGDPVVCEDHMGVVQYEGGQFNGSVGTLRDITDQKARERELETINSQYQTLVENFPDGAVFLFDTELEYVRAGGQELAAVGLSAEEVTGATPHDLFPEEIAEKTAHYYRETIDGASHTYEQEYDGEQYRIQTTPVRPGDGEIAYGLSVSQNVTEEAERRQELERQKRQLEEFASIVSHDLRNPLAVAEGTLELARETRESDYLARAADAIDRSQALIEDLLTLARQGETVAEVQPVAFEDVVETSWRTVDTAQASLEVDVSPAVEADQSRLRELFENLYRNAVEHGGDDVTVAVGTIDDGFYVADTGPGIPESDREDVFEAGYSTNDGGTGFGLRIVEQIVDAHGWEVAVTESDQGGARFEVTGVEFADR
ncbi:MAG: sensor histidine kinase, partial [Haloferacaceae archaeon]